MSAAYREFLRDDDKRVGRSKSTKCTSPGLGRSSSRAILTVSFVRDYSIRVQSSWSDIRATIPGSFAHSFVHSFVSPRYGLQRVILATLCTYRSVRACVYVRAWVYPLVRLLPLPMKSHYIIEMPPRWCLMKLVRKQDFAPGRISRRSKRWGRTRWKYDKLFASRDPFCPCGIHYMRREKQWTKVTEK